MNTATASTIAIDQDTVRDALLSHLMRGGTFGHYWTPDGKPFVKDGRTITPKYTQWFDVANPKPPIADWLEKNLYWGVHPTTCKGIDPDIKPNKQRSSVAIVAAVNCVFSEFDGKDYVQPDEYALHLPGDFAKLPVNAASDAVDDAQEAAFAVDPARYKARSWQHIDQMPLAPSVIVDSGGGYHVYHLFAEPVMVDESNRQHIADVQAAWVHLVGSDPSSKDLARVLRVPGTHNRKPYFAPDYPLCSVVTAEFERLYTLADFERLIEGVRIERVARPVSIGSTNGYHGDDYESAVDALRRLAPWRCDDRDEWIRVGMSLKAGLGDAGLQLWDQWSQGSRKYAPGDCDGRWKTLRPSSMSLGTLIWRAQEDNPKPKQDSAHVYEYAFAPPADLPDPATLDVELTPEERNAAAVDDDDEPRRKLLSERITEDLAKWGYVLTMCELDDSIEVNGVRLNDNITAQMHMRARDKKYGGRDGTPLTALDDQVRVLAMNASYHPVKDYLERQQWDGLDHFAAFIAHLKDKHTPIVYEDGTKKTVVASFFWRWLIGAVAKVYGRGAIRPQNPMLVLSGAQNMGKSTLAAWLCALPDMFIESSINPDSNDHLRYLVTKWIWEVSELGATTRRSDREALKAFLTRQEATFRKPYDHHPTIKPALASFIGTVNPMNSGFLDDPTGSRRFLVVDLAHIDHGYAKTVDRDQLWAQVVAAYQADPQAWRLSPEEQEKRDGINAENEVERPYEGIIARIFDIDPIRTDWWMPTSEIVDAVRTYGDAVFDETRHHGVLGSTLRGFGLERKQARVNGERVWGYFGIQIRPQFTQGAGILP